MSSETEHIPITLSIVIPLLDEELVIPELLHRVNQTLDKLNITSEILLIDDGSTDSTISTILSIRQEFFREIRVIKLQKNQGHMKALEIGMSEANGSYVVTMDADLQDPPELIENLWNQICSSKFEIIQAVRSDRSKDSFYKRITASLFYKIANRLLNINVIAEAADFRIMSQRAVQSILALPDRKKIYRFIIPNLGYAYKTIEFIRDQRYAGTTKYTFRKMLNLAVDSLFTFSSIPLKMVTNLGIIISVVFFLCTPVIFFLHARYNLVPGWASLITLYLAGNGVIIFSIGIVGKYVREIYEHLFTQKVEFIEL